MTATEIIEAIKSLSPQEQAQIVEFVNELKAKPEVSYMDEKTFTAAVDRVFTQHEELLRKLASS